MIIAKSNNTANPVLSRGAPQQRIFGINEGARDPLVNLCSMYKSDAGLEVIMASTAKYIIIFFASFTIGFISLTDSYANIKIFEREYVYQAGEIDSKISSRVIALEQVKRLLLEELGTAIISTSTVKNGQLTKDEITSLAGGYVKTLIIDESWDGKTYRIKARIEADPEEVLSFVRRVMSDQSRVKELKKTNKQAEALTLELARLKQELRLAPDNEKVKQYNEIVNKLAVLGLLERAFSLAEGKNLDDEKDIQKNLSTIREIIDTYSKIIMLMPDWSLAYQMRMLYYSVLKEHDKALEDINSALKYDNWNIQGIMRKDIEPDDLPQLHSDLRKQKAYALLKLGYPSASIDELEALIKIDPHLRLHDWFWNIDDFNYLVKKFPQDYRTYLIRGIYYSDNYVSDHKKSVDLAIKDYQKAQALRPKEATSYYLLAYEYFIYFAPDGAQGEKQQKHMNLKSRQLLLQAEKLTCSKAIGRSIYDLLASTYNDAGEYDQALKAYNKAIQIDPDYGDLYLDKARLYMREKKYDKALDGYGKALDSKNKISAGMQGRQFVHVVLYLRADANYEAGRYADAVKDYTQTIDSKTKDLIRDELEPSEFLSQEYMGRGKALLALEKHREAIDDFTSVMKSKIHNDLAYEYRARAYAALGNYTEALNDYNAFLKRWNTSDWYKGFYPEGLYFERGNVYFKLKQYKEAIADYDFEITGNPSHFSALANRGTCYLILGIYDKAITDFNRALKLNANDVQCLVHRGRALMLSNNINEAIRDFDKALKFDATNEWAYFYRCTASIELGYAEKGINDCRTAARLGCQEAQNFLRLNQQSW